jgi:hypothetical protein
MRHHEVLVTFSVRIFLKRIRQRFASIFHAAHRLVSFPANRRRRHHENE